VFLPDLVGVTMREPALAPVTARKAALPAADRADAPAEVVCVALALAVVVLACRIFSVW